MASLKLLVIVEYEGEDTSQGVWHQDFFFHSTGYGYFLAKDEVWLQIPIDFLSFILESYKHAEQFNVASF